MNDLIIHKIATGAAVATLATVLDTAQIPFQEIACVNWPAYPYRPEVKFRAAHDGEHLYLNYRVEENDIQAVCDTDNGPVWEDSCVECFLSFGDEAFYYNIEANCIGTVLVGCRTGRDKAQHASQELLDRIERQSSLGRRPVKGLSGRWELSLKIPKEVFFAGNIPSLDGLVARGNFYKCGDKLSVPHYLSWQPIHSEKPNFHQPKFFRTIKFEG